MSWLWAVTFALPLAVAAALALLNVTSSRTGAAGRGRSLLLDWCQLAVLPALVLTLLPAATVTVRWDWVLTGASFRLDVISRALTFVTVLLYGAALTAVDPRKVRRPGVLQGFLLLCFVGNIGAYAAADTVTFYLFFALMSYSALGLVLHNRTAEAHRAGVVYLVLAVLSETFTLAGLILIAGAGGQDLAGVPAAVAASPHHDLIVALVIVGFGIKAGLVPLHVWLPLAHPAAPPTASAVLSGAMVKAGLVGWLRFLPLGEGGFADAGRALVIAGIVGAFASVPIGLAQRNPKTVLAYSTISQLGFLTIVVGVALAVPALAPACITAAVIYAVHHGLAKAVVFLAVPVWQHHAHRRSGWLVAVGTLIAGLAIVGAPLSSGAVGKYAAKNAVDGVVLWGFDLVSLLPWVATGSTLLLIRFWSRLQTMETEPAARPDRELLAWVFLVAMCIPVPWILGDWWVPLTAVPDLDPVTLWDAAWPVLAGLAIAAVLWWQWPRLSRLPAVPAGDLVVVYENGISGVARVIRSVRRRWVSPELDLAGVRQGGRLLDRAEHHVGGWSFGLGAVVVLVVAMVGGSVMGGGG